MGPSTFHHSGQYGADILSSDSCDHVELQQPLQPHAVLNNEKKARLRGAGTESGLKVCPEQGLNLKRKISQQRDIRPAEDPRFTVDDAQSADSVPIRRLQRVARVKANGIDELRHGGVPVVCRSVFDDVHVRASNRDIAGRFVAWDIVAPYPGRRAHPQVFTFHEIEGCPLSRRRGRVR